MSASGNTAARGQSSRTAQTVSTSSVVARARAEARPRPGLVKLERHPDGYVRTRDAGSGKRGQMTRVDMDDRATREILAAVLAGRDALLAVRNSDAAGKHRARARHDALVHLELAGKLVARLLEGEPSERDEAHARDLTARNVDELAALPVGAVVYSGGDGIEAHHVAHLRAAVERRGLRLEKIGPYFFRIEARLPATPPMGSCTCCGYARTERDGRCSRCGTQTRAA